MVHPFQQVLEMVEPALPEAGHLACPVDQGGERAELRGIMCLASFMAVAYQPGLFQNAEMLGYGRLRHPGLGCQGPTVCSPSRQRRSKIARRVGSASDRKRMSGGSGIKIHNLLVIDPIDNRLDMQVKAKFGSAGQRPRHELHSPITSWLSIMLDGRIRFCCLGVVTKAHAARIRQRLVRQAASFHQSAL